jgi:hypothetical protein
MAADAVCGGRLSFLSAFALQCRYTLVALFLHGADELAQCAGFRVFFGVLFCLGRSLSFPRCCVFFSAFSTVYVAHGWAVGVARWVVAIRSGAVAVEGCARYIAQFTLMRGRKRSHILGFF